MEAERTIWGSVTGLHLGPNQYGNVKMLLDYATRLLSYVML